VKLGALSTSPPSELRTELWKAEILVYAMYPYVVQLGGEVMKMARGLNCRQRVNQVTWRVLCSK
jgi:hypothetical protein